jgi:hypothetical protein
MTAGEGPGEDAAGLDLGFLEAALEGVWAAFTEDVDMARPIWFGSENKKPRFFCAALIGTRQRSVIAAACAGEQYGVAC